MDKLDNVNPQTFEVSAQRSRSDADFDDRDFGHFCRCYNSRLLNMYVKC